MADLGAITRELIAGNMDEVLRLVQGALDNGTPAKEILNNGLIAGMDVVGQRMESGDMYIPEVLRSAKVMSKAVELLRPQLGEGEAHSSGRVVMGTVKGDLHDIGKNLVAMMIESAGFEVIDLGIDVPPENFVNAVREKKPQLLGLSTLLTTTMPMIKNTLDALTESGLRESVKVMVGGAPVTQSFSEQVGADGYAPDAGSASKLAKKLVQQ